MRGYFSQARFPGCNCPNEGLFYQLKLLPDGLERIALVGAYRYSLRGAGRRGFIDSYWFQFCFVNQISSGWRNKPSAKMS